MGVSERTSKESIQGKKKKGHKETSFKWWVQEEYQAEETKHDVMECKDRKFQEVGVVNM